MHEIPVEYLLELSRQIIFISAFLGGFSATFLATVLTFNSEKRFSATIIVVLAIAACMFIVAVLAFVGIILTSHPESMVPDDIAKERVIGFVSLMLGIYSLLAGIGLSGFLHSNRIGKITSAVGVFAWILITWMLFDVG